MDKKNGIDGYRLLKDNPWVVAAVERMARVKIVFEEDLPKEEESGR